MRAWDHPTHRAFKGPFVAMLTWSRTQPMHMRVHATPRVPWEGLDPGEHGWHAPPCGPGDAWLHVSMATQAAMLAWEDTELA